MYSTLADRLSVKAYSKPPPAAKPASVVLLLVEVMTVLLRCPIESVVLRVSKAKPAVTKNSERSENTVVPQRMRRVERNVAWVVLVMASGATTGMLIKVRVAEPPSQLASTSTPNTQPML